MQDSIVITSKRHSLKKIEEAFPSAVIIDTTSKAKDKFIQLSPFYPHGDIPVPFSSEHHSKSVEGVWQGLKVFENADIDISKFQIESMQGLKRSERKLGKVQGHRKGVNGKELIDYLEARKTIYLPTYEWVLRNKVYHLLIEIKSFSVSNQVILLDYETNGDVSNLKKPLSHAALVKTFIHNNFKFI